MSSTSSFDAFGFGLCAWDRLLLFEHYPGLDQKVQAIASAASGGGPVPTALAILSRLGGRAAFIGSAGDDSEGLRIHRDLESFGVDVKNLFFRPQRRSAQAYIWVDQKDGRRTVALDPGDAESVKPEELPANLIAHTPLLLMDGRDVESCLMAAKLCHEGGGQVVLDAGSPRDRIEELLAVTDHAVVSQSFVRGTFPGAWIREVLRKIQALGPATVVVTTGSHGGQWRDGLDSGRYAAFDVNVVDTTGAGDAFHGGYLYGLLKGWNIEKRCKFAAGVAAGVCRGLGGRATAPSYPEVLEIIGDFE